VIFSLLTKIVLLPLTLKSTESMKRMQELSPKVKEIQKKYKSYIALSKNLKENCRK
jgi:YidC/Oxa1 family membrane protein insertase